jgi:hypothetical protein
MAISTLPLKAVQVRIGRRHHGRQVCLVLRRQARTHVTDSELVSQLCSHGCVGPYQVPVPSARDNMRRVNAEPHLLSVVPAGVPAC